MDVFVVLVNGMADSEFYGVFADRTLAERHCSSLSVGRDRYVLEVPVKGDVTGEGKLYVAQRLLAGDVLVFEGVYGNYDAARRASDGASVLSYPGFA